MWHRVCHILERMSALPVVMLNFMGNWLLRTYQVLRTGLITVVDVLGRLVLSASKFLLTALFSTLERIGAISGRWLLLAGALIYAVIPWIILSSLLYLVIRFAPERSCIAWIVLGVSSVAASFWVYRWTRPQPVWPKAVPIEHLGFFYLVSTFVLLVALFTCAYLAANKLGGSALNFRTGVPLIGFWEFLQFSIVTATTLGHNSITTKGISCYVECVEVVQFWLFVVILGVRLKPREVD